MTPEMASQWKQRYDAARALRAQTEARKPRETWNQRINRGIDSIAIYLCWVLIGVMGYLVLRVLVRGLLY
jgi:hypothetical protein